MSSSKDIGTEEWQEWNDSLVTREFFNYLKDFKQHLLESLPSYIGDLAESNKIVGKLEFIDDVHKEIQNKITGG